MRNVLLSLFFSLFLISPLASYAASSGIELDSVDIDLSDKTSLQRGAKLFVNYCLSCHSASFMRYNRMAKDIGMTEDELKANLMFGPDKVGDTMTIAMRPDDAKKWFGVAPPDLSVISRAKGTDWLYSYMRTFYLDDTKVMGVNNLVFKDVGMPHVLWQQQGYLVKDEKTGELVSQNKAKNGSITPDEYDATIRDLVNFMAYMGEPSKIQRLELGKWVLLYFVIFFLVAYPMKKAFWKDVH